MNMRLGKLLLWSPRILGVLVCLFLSLFALDAFGGGNTFIQALPDFAIHVAPMLILLAVVGVSWRWEWVGGLVFTGLAATYAYFARNHIDWILVIAGPLLIVGILFFWSWLHHRKLRASA
jgi:CHASE2 domain-containing sensor protein